MESETEHPGQLKMKFDDIPNHEKEYLREAREPVTEMDKPAVTSHMRTQFFKEEGWYAPDEDVYEWYWKTPRRIEVGKAYTKEILKAFEEKGAMGKVKPLIQDGGGGRNYYDLPPNPEQLLDLIEYRNMNGNIKDIFKACYRLGQKEGTSEEYDLRKMVLYSLRELGRVTDRKDYVDLAIEVIGHHDRMYANTH